MTKVEAKLIRSMFYQWLQDLSRKSEYLKNKDANAATALEKHLVEVHVDQDQCVICGETFEQTNSWRTHVRMWNHTHKCPRPDCNQMVFTHAEYLHHVGKRE